MLKKIKERAKNKKGFTLIELIIVIVILVILAAIAIPSLASYMDRANKGKVSANARAAYTALCVLTVEEAAKTTPVYAGIAADTALSGSTAPTLDTVKTQAGLTGVNCTITVTVAADGTVSAFKYVETGYTAELSGNFAASK